MRGSSSAGSCSRRCSPSGDVTTDDLDRVLAGVRGNPMAKATLIDAFLDAELRTAGRSFAQHLGATTDRVDCGVSVGITRTTDQLLDAGGRLSRGGVPAHQAEDRAGPGRGTRARGPRGAPGTQLSVDANAAYTLADVDVFLALDELDLLMVEQPLHHDDLVRHAKLQARIRTDICLDESIRSAADATAAIELGACRIINIKQGRVGGVPEARRIHDVARARERPRLVRRHARDRDRQGHEPGARRAPGVHAPGRHQRVRPLLRRRHHGAVRGRGGRHDGRSRWGRGSAWRRGRIASRRRRCASRRSRRDRRLVRRAA